MIDNWRDAWIDAAFFVSAIMLVISLNRLSSPKTAPFGNQLGAAGLVLATIATFFLAEVERNYVLIIIAILIGGGVGYLMAQRVQMTAMPQMIAILNGMGGAASALIAVTEFMGNSDMDRTTVLSAVLGCIIGGLRQASGTDQGEDDGDRQPAGSFRRVDRRDGHRRRDHRHGPEWGYR
jgi:NAD(P) transhydrogenase subunit beta